jgi:Domain of unknown function (DUF397)
MTEAHHGERTWRKSTFSGEGGCLEVCASAGGVEIRDSKDPDGPRLSFTDVEWTAFTAGVRAGEF